MFEDGLETITGHLEETDLMRRPESILHTSKDSVSVMPIAFEGQHHVDEVLEKLRTGQLTILGHMTDDENGDSGLLGQKRELGGASSELTGRSRPRTTAIAPGPGTPGGGAHPGHLNRIY